MSRRRIALAIAATALAVGIGSPAFADKPGAEEHKGCNQMSANKRDSAGRSAETYGWWVYAGKTVGFSSNQMYGYAEVRTGSPSVAAAARWPYTGGVLGNPINGVDVGVDTASPALVCYKAPVG